MIAWCGATALAVGVSWLGVRDVLRSAILDEAPLAPVVAVDAPQSASPAAPTPGVVPGGEPSRMPSEDPAGEPSEEPDEEPSEKPSSGATPGRPSPSRTAAAPARTSPAPRTIRTTRSAAPPQPSPASKPRKTSSGESLHTFTLTGGRATIAVTAKDCHVVTATPNDGYEVKVWETDQWLRVAFLQDAHESSAFCVWNVLPPRLDTYEN
ncbi:hypothetical protein GCM10010116_29460 [Microbispora rosea subsp. aerata]|nr:hypothetical protein GCM10010116_29460 [Microbispora rosea subsp. aerata]GIH55560.1 hypothetical protein Mro02_24740 [Microbispora rosea subsp. aerata]GLJ86504.1 hypothetical protein GCM10017588_52420 [Microbispora rosea subsp. aerata]